MIFSVPLRLGSRHKKTARPTETPQFIELKSWRGWSQTALSTQQTWTEEIPSFDSAALCLPRLCRSSAACLLSRYAIDLHRSCSMQQIYNEDAVARRRDCWCRRFRATTTRECGIFISSSAVGVYSSCCTRITLATELLTDATSCLSSQQLLIQYRSTKKIKEMTTSFAINWL